LSSADKLEEAEKSLAEQRNKSSKSVLTEVEILNKFYVAEKKHQKNALRQHSSILLTLKNSNVKVNILIISYLIDFSI